MSLFQLFFRKKPIIKIILLDKLAQIPKKQSSEAAGYDLYARMNTPITINSMERVIIPTGLLLIIPKGYLVSIRPRSGLALQYGISLPNTPGTIDSDYQGELKILMINLGLEPFTVHDNMRIAQMLVEKSLDVQFKITNDYNPSTTDRGSSGFGSTGI